MVAAYAGIVDPVHVAPVPGLGQVRGGQILMRARVGPGKRDRERKERER